MAQITIKLGARPKIIHRIVKVPLAEGGEGLIEVDFKYRTRREYGALVDELLATGSPLAQVAADGVQASGQTFAAMADATVRKNAVDLLKILEGWSLDVPMSEETLDQLCDEFPGIAEQLMTLYRQVLTEARLGN